MKPRHCWNLGMAVIALFLMCGGTAFAGEKSGNWRETYDLVMMWVNFGLLVFVIVKFGRVPVRDFLSGRRDEIRAHLQRMEEEKDRVAEQVKGALQTMDESDARFAELKARIIEMGQQGRQQLIEEARQESAHMMAEARRKVDNLVIRAQKDFQAELVDAAMLLAEERLPQIITHKDQEKYFDLFMRGIAA